MEKFDGNLDELEVLSKGYWGTIYALSDKYLIKTSTTSEDMTIDEFKRSRAVYEAGVPCAEPVKMVETVKGPAIIVERISGRSIARRASMKLESLDTYIDAFVKLAKKMWSISIPDNTLPTLKSDWLDLAKLYREFMSDEIVDKYVKFVNALPDDNKFLHMDFHWSNVMFNGGDSRLIDLPNACVGHPAIDMTSIACFYNLIPKIGFEDRTYQDVFRINEEEAAYVWDGVCQRMFEGLPENVAAERKECCEKMSSLVYSHNFMRDYVLGTASQKCLDDITGFITTIVNEDGDFILRVLSEWKWVC